MKVIFTVLILVLLILLYKEYKKVEKVKYAISNLNSHITETIIYLCTRHFNNATSYKLDKTEKRRIKDWFNKIKQQQEDLILPSIVSKEMEELEKGLNEFFNDYCE